MWSHRGRWRHGGRRRGRGLIELAIAGALLTAVWWRLPQGSPPVYDGLCGGGSSAPYAYLSPPPGVARIPSASGSHSVGVDRGVVLGTYVATAETEPQAQIRSDAGALRLPAGASSVTVTIDPVPMPGIQPDDGQVDGNAYRYQASAGNRATAAVDPGKPVMITLRPAVVTGVEEVIERFDGDHWTPLQSGLDTCYLTTSALTDRLGVFVLVGPQSGSPSVAPSPSPARVSPQLLVLGLVILLVVILIMLWRSPRSGTGDD